MSRRAINRDSFREFERFCIEYDIAIDEEEPEWQSSEEEKQFHKDECRWPLPNEDNALYRDFGFLDDEIKKLPSKLEISRDWRDEYKRLILAKRTRAVLQSKNSTKSLSSLDYLAQYLIKWLPECSELPCESSNPEDSQHLPSIESFLLRVMYLIEISACYRGFLSIGYADQCLDLINEVFKDKKGKTPYELVALFNKAQGYSHTRDHSKALKEFRKITVREDSEEYFGGKKWYQWNEDDKGLFDKYVIIPSVLMEAETLIKLQRCEEAKEALKAAHAKDEVKFDANTKLTEYQQQRRQIIRRRIYNDLAYWRQKLHLSHNPPRLVDRLNSYLTKVEDKLKSKQTSGRLPKALQSQWYSVLIERWLQMCGGCCDYLDIALTGEAHVEQPKIEQCFSTLHRALDKVGELSVLQIHTNQHNEPEKADALLDWVKGLNVCIQVLQRAERLSKYMKDIDEQVFHSTLRSIARYVFERSGSNFILELALEMIRSKQHHPHQLEMRETLLRSMRSLLRSMRSLAPKMSFNSENPSGALCVFTVIPIRLKCILKFLVDYPEYPHEPVSALEQQRYSEWLREFSNENLNDWSVLRRLLLTQFFPKCAESSDGLDNALMGCQLCNGDRERCWEWKSIVSWLKNSLKGEPSCVGDTEGLKHYYDGVIERNRQTIDSKLWRKNTYGGAVLDWGFIVLRRWNSYTPALAASDGGGYFLFHRNNDGNIDIGVAIDPGYGFVKNLLSEGFGISDITAILVSHDHPDHIEDFSKIISLLIEQKKARQQETKRLRTPVVLGLCEGAFERLRPIIESPAARDVIQDTRLLEARRGDNTTSRRESKVTFKPGVSRCSSASIVVHAIDARHEGTLRSGDGIGFKVDLYDCLKEAKVATIGLPCDTKWNPDIAKEYRDCDLMCLHIGSIIPEGFSLVDYFCEREAMVKVLHEKQHLYLPGTLWFLNCIQGSVDTDKGSDDGGRLVILSEFGEELRKGLRPDLCSKINAFFNPNRDTCSSVYPQGVAVIPGDIGLTVDPVKKRIQCSCCGHFYPWRFVFKAEPYGEAEEIRYICRSCQLILSQDQKCRILATK